MNERALRVLEFTKIRDMLSGFALSDAGKEKCQSLTPLETLQDVNRALDETEEAVVCLTFLGGHPLISFEDIAEYLSLAEKGAVLSPKALLSVAQSLRAARTARNALVTEKENTPLITSTASRLGELTELKKNDCVSVIADANGELIFGYVTERPATPHEGLLHCQHCGKEVEWMDWNSSTSLPTGDGHFILLHDVKVSRET